MPSDETLPPDDSDRTRHLGEEPPSEAVVHAVAEARDCDPLDLPPLNDALDPDALDELFDDTVAGRPREGRGRIVFEYADATVALLGPDELVVDVNG